MKASARSELNSIISELGSIIKEMEAISSGVKNDFAGIGNENCASAIDKVTDKYYTVRSTLQKI